MACNLDDATHEGLVALAVSLATNHRTDRVALQKAVEALCEPHYLPPPPTTKTLMGVIWSPDMTSVGGGGVQKFSDLTGGIDCIAAYPAGRTGKDGMKAAEAAVAAFPHASINTLTLMVGNSVSAEDEAKRHQALAKKSGRPYYCKMNGEPDRKDRSYTPDQWHARFDEFDAACALHAPDVRLVVNLTGYEFGKRIDAWKRAFLNRPKERRPVLAVDPYWRPKPSAIQAGEADLAAAVQWCLDNDVQIAWGEAGVDPGEGFDFRIRRFFHWIEDTNPLFVPYFQLVGAWDSRMLTMAEFDLYRTLKSALG